MIHGDSSDSLDLFQFGRAQNLCIRSDLQVEGHCNSSHRVLVCGNWGLTTGGSSSRQKIDIHHSITMCPPSHHMLSLITHTVPLKRGQAMPRFESADASQTLSKSVVRSKLVYFHTKGEFLRFGF